MPEHPVQLFTTDSLVLTCEIELIPEVDSYVTINSQWRGHSSLNDRERRVIVSDLEGLQLTYNTSVTFSTLKSSDSGSYICSAAVIPQERTSNLLQSQLIQQRISISVGRLISSAYNDRGVHLFIFSVEGDHNCIIQQSI